MSEKNKVALRVATDLRHVQVNDSADHPLDVMLDSTVYRLLDAPYYAWLRRRMDRARKAHEAGRLAAQTWETLRQRFNGINTWALKHLGEKALVDAMATLDEKSYVAPTHDHAVALVDSWEERAAIMEHDGGLDHEAAEQSAAACVSRELTPADVESFRALGVEVGVKSKQGDFTVVPEYSDNPGNTRTEISAEDLRKLSMVMAAFPGTKITYVGPQQDPWEPVSNSPRSSQVAPAASQIPKSLDRSAKHNSKPQSIRQPQQARLF